MFVDVDPETFTMDPALLERAITPRTKVILPVHLYGHPADMAPILEIAARHGSPCWRTPRRRTGPRSTGRRAGSLGHAACFSFYPGKNLGAYGDAGMVVSDDASFVDPRAPARQPRRRREQVRQRGGGHQQPPRHAAGGGPAREAAAPRRVERASAASACEAYTQALAGRARRASLPRERAGRASAWHLYTVRPRDRDGLQAHLAAQGIATAVHYPRPIHLQPAMAAAGGRPGDLPVSERLCDEVLSLPLYPELRLETVERVAAEVRRA